MSKTQVKPTREKLPPSPDEAAAILGSAVRYCQKAGVKVAHITGDGALWLAFPGFEIVPLRNGTVEIRNGTPSPPVPLPQPEPEKGNGTATAGGTPV